MNKILKSFYACIILSVAACSLKAQQPYPYPAHYLPLSIEQRQVRMAYMDVPPQHEANGKTVLLFHGKNFNGYYWGATAEWLSTKGYRVLIPDQTGWGKSDKPDIHYSFHQLAANNKALLDSLHITRVILIGHSMGGMLAARFAMLYPAAVQQLVLEDPIGLEDYRTFVPYKTNTQLYANEAKQNFDSYKQYMKGYFPQWKPEYDELVLQQAAALQTDSFPKIAWVNALTYQMIYEQPVCYEFARIKVPTLVLAGTEDRTIVGKDQLSDSVKKQHGQYPQLSRQVQAAIKGSRLYLFPAVGHIPHIQQPEAFRTVVSGFIQ